MTESYEIYIPWLEGRVGYDCAGCQARCCRGAGRIGMPPDEEAFLLARYPALAAFRRDIEGAAYAVYQRTRPQCFFLRPDERCDIEVGHGRAHKPLVCRAHPIYFTPHAEAGLVVTWLHGLGCTFCEGPTATTPDHAEVRSLRVESAAAGLLDKMASEAPKLPWRGATLRAVIAGEERIRDASGDGAPLERYLAWQLAAARAFVQQGADQAGEPAADAVDAAYDELTAQGERIAALVGRADASVPPPLGARLAPYVPALRVMLLGLARPLPAFADPNLDGAERLLLAPRLLLALAHLAAAHEAVGGPGATPTTYATWSDMLAELPTRLYALADPAHADAFGDEAGPLALEAAARAVGEARREAAMDSLAETAAELDLERPLVVAAAVRARWTAGSIWLDGAQGEGCVESEDALLLALVSEFAAPTRPREVLERFHAAAPEDVQAAIEGLYGAGVLVPSDDA